MAEVTARGGAGRWHPRWDLEDLISASQDLFRLSPQSLAGAAAQRQPEAPQSPLNEPRSLKKDSLRGSLENVGALSKTLFLFTPSSFWLVEGF